MWTTLLSGIVGSRAYGLAGPGSDTDRLAVAAAPTEQFHGLNPPTGKNASRVTTQPDVTVHEVGKYVSLALVANPTITELMWLPDEFIETHHPLADGLIEMRRKLLSAQAVKNAYFGYAHQQFVRLQNKGKFPDLSVDRIAKHARHLHRLVTQGTQLYMTGSLTVQVANPVMCREFGRLVAEEPAKGIELAKRFMSMNLVACETNGSALPEQPDREAAEKWLRHVRLKLWKRS